MAPQCTVNRPTQDAVFWAFETLDNKALPAGCASRKKAARTCGLVEAKIELINCAQLRIELEKNGLVVERDFGATFVYAPPPLHSH